MNRISLEQETQFLTTVIMCGPPPRITQAYRSRDGRVTPRGRIGWNDAVERGDWLDKVYALCHERFGIINIHISPFVRELDEWWFDNKGEYHD